MAFSKCLSSLLAEQSAAQSWREGVPMPENYEKTEEAIFLVAVGVFLFVSFVSLVSILAKYRILAEHDLVLKFGLSAVSFMLAVICFQLTPASQGRTLRNLVDKLVSANAESEEQGPSELHGRCRLTADDIVKLNQNVGSAGFFNRIGLTGVPLTVAVFALIFCGLTFVATKLGPNYQSISAASLDLTKLTVGAFIGALTRNVSDSKAQPKE